VFENVEEAFGLRCGEPLAKSGERLMGGKIG
jgi:hypothetical protein